MADNKILAFRRKKGITQKQLADLVGTSQQQLHRIEAGKQSVRFDLAEKICSAFHEPMELVFPGTKKPLEKLNKKYRKPSTPNFDDKDFVEAMTRADVDMDPAEWSLEYRLRGGAKGALVISSIEKSRRLFVVVQRGQGHTDLFVVFDSEGTRVVLNLDHLTFCRFLYDAPQLSNIPPPDCDSGENVRVFMTDSSEPLPSK